MRWKATVLVLLVLIVPLTIRHKLAVFMIEESLVVLFAVFTLLRACARLTFQWLVARLRRTGGLGEHQQARPKPVR